MSLPNYVFFFNAVCSRVIDPKKLDELKKNIVVTLCQLEMYFLPSFFDIMVHLTVYLVRKIKLCALVFLKWMYQFERYMKIGMNLIFCVYMLSCSLFFRWIIILCTFLLAHVIVLESSSQQRVTACFWNQRAARESNSLFLFYVERTTPYWVAPSANYKKTL